MSYQPLYFSTPETRCKCADCAKRTDHQPLSEQLLIRLDLIRTIINAPIRINSGWRCEAHNRASRGVEKSYHLQGRAADITADDLGELFAAAIRLDKIYIYKFVELIKYPQDRFLHVAV